MSRLNSLVAFGTLAVSACVTGPAPKHQVSQLNQIALSCGLESSQLVQSDVNRLLIIDRADASRQQRSCVDRWARSNGMRSLLVNVQFQDDTSEGQRMLALLAAASSTMVLTKVDPTYLPAININGKIHRVLAVTITGEPPLIPPLKQKLNSEGWKIVPSSNERLALVSPMGHSLDEVTGLSFRVTNGEFGNLKFNVTMKPDGKTDLVIKPEIKR